MGERVLRLTRRRLLGGLGTVAAASAATGAGTVAYFGDTESSTGNSVRAGTLDLALDGGDQTVTFLDVSDIAPGDRGAQSVALGNRGSLEGDLVIRVDEWRDYENGISGQENGVDDTPNRGELQNYLLVRALVDGTAVTDWYYVADLARGQSFSTGETIAPGGTRQFTTEWWFEDPANGTANDAQSDSVELDLTFRLEQTR